jgi:hypothetical protein
VCDCGAPLGVVIIAHWELKLSLCRLFGHALVHPNAQAPRAPYPPDPHLVSGVV